MTIRHFLKDLHKTFILHAVAAHFSNGLIPVVVFFLLLTLMTFNPYLDHTILHLNLVALGMIPVSFLSGIRDWRNKFQAGRAPIFYRKLWLSGLLLLLCAAVVTLRLTWPEILQQSGLRFWLYIGCLFAMLPVVVLLGHYGGRLSAQVYRMK